MDGELESLFADVFAEDNDRTEQTENAQAAEQPEQESGKPQEAEKAQEQTEAPKPEQTPEERARQAEGRRIREREQKAYQAGREAAMAEFNATLGLVGFRNPKTQEIVATSEALKQYAEELSDQRTNAGTPTAADIRRIAQEANQTQTAAAGKADMDRELEFIRDMDPDMKDLKAILASDIGPAFRGYVQNGATFTQAYARATRDKQSLAAKQQASAAAKSAGKDHLSATSSRGEGGLNVPADELKLFRAMMPGASDAEIRKYYNADRKKYGPKS